MPEQMLKDTTDHCRVQHTKFLDLHTFAFDSSLSAPSVYVVFFEMLKGNFVQVRMVVIMLSDCVSNPFVLHCFFSKRHIDTFVKE